MTGASRTPTLVLWDVDQTLVDVWSVTQRAYASAFRRATGKRLCKPWQFSGRTELAAAEEVLRAHDVDPAAALGPFLELIVQEPHERADQMRETGQVLSGAGNALRACGSVPGVHQSLLTGNLYRLAMLKMNVFGLAEHLDLRLGAYGEDARDRLALPQHAWRRAEQHLAHRCDGSRTVIVGDTVLDVATGRTAGARVVVVATGTADPAQLQAGADVVLPDLADTGAVLDAILPPGAGVDEAAGRAAEWPHHSS